MRCQVEFDITLRSELHFRQITTRDFDRKFQRGEVDTTPIHNATVSRTSIKGGSDRWWLECPPGFLEVDNRGFLKRGG